MSTYFDTVSMSFTDVGITDEGIDTQDYLEASEGVVKMFELVGTGAFSFVSSDILGNMKKVQAVYDAHPDDCPTLEKLVLFEKDKPLKARSATEALVWLLRGQRFLLVGLQRSFNDPNEELIVSFNKSYDENLKPHHNLLVRSVVPLAMKATPYRKDFYTKLGDPVEKVQEQMKEWLDALESLINRMDRFFESGKLADGFELE